MVVIKRFPSAAHWEGSGAAAFSSENRPAEGHFRKMGRRLVRVCKCPKQPGVELRLCKSTHSDNPGPLNLKYRRRLARVFSPGGEALWGQISNNQPLLPERREGNMKPIYEVVLGLFGLGNENERPLSKSERGWLCKCVYWKVGSKFLPPR